jgi:hypothetical protein
VERVLAGVPEDEQEKMLWKNAVRLFKLNVESAGAPA